MIHVIFPAAAAKATASGMTYLVYPIAAAFIICLFIGPFVIGFMKKLKFGQQVRDDGPKTHLAKKNTPTIGGLMILIALSATCLIAKVHSMALVALLTTLAYGIVGFLDDYIKIAKKRSLGLRAYQKIIGQFGIAAVAAIYAYKSPMIGSAIYIPVANIELELGWFYIPFAIFVIIAMVNAVNLTDGLDGLASGVMLIIMASFAIILGYLAFNLGEQGSTARAGEIRSLAIFSSAVAGACLGFLRFNVYPARIFMGDTGALALGGAIAAVGLFSRFALLLPIMAGVTVASVVSVILQVGSFKLRHGKRIFKMAPLHHHFELCGYPETTVVSMYMIITGLLCLLTFIIMG